MRPFRLDTKSLQHPSRNYRTHGAGIYKTFDSGADLCALALNGHGNTVIIYNMKTIAITMDETTLDRIDRLVDSDSPGARNRSRVIREAVRDYLSRIERLNEEERERLIYKKHRARIARQTAALVKEQAKS